MTDQRKGIPFDDERARFVAWTFEQELSLLEERLGDFDRHSPNADLSTARFAMELQSDAGDENDPAETMPCFLGHDMSWWAYMARTCLTLRDGAPSPDALLDHLGIRDAVLAWIKAENAWEKRRAAERRKAARQGRNWLGEMLPKVR